MDFLSGWDHLRADLGAEDGETEDFCELTLMDSVLDEGAELCKLELAWSLKT